ncbi:MAG: GNAT family N-acetyltransferase [Oscillospiraceae bacterium]|nr:GNAT family N-acetyltransferase [Oscillospiraceae bacterium]
MTYTVTAATRENAETVAALALQLWPRSREEALLADIAALLCREDCFFALCTDAAGEAVGFAQCQLRRDYVEGCSHSPAGYLEGIFVAEAHRRRGAARQLLAACKAWAKQQGCHEFASDCELTNRESAAFHAAMGFAEAGRNIHFVQSL